MFDFFIKASQIIMPVFVMFTMFQVGLTQKPQALLKYYRQDWEFFGRMLFTNFFIAPSVMLMLVLIGRNVLDTDLLDGVALTILSLTAGAPFLIKLAELSDNDMALGASLLLLLVVGTVVFTPMLLPLILPSLDMNALSMAWSLIKSLIIPVIVGMQMASFLPNVVKKIQPWVAQLGKYSMYLVLASIFIGYLPQITAFVGTGSILLGLVFVLVMALTGYFMGGKRGDADLKDIGALRSAQRNIAASMMIASQNFADSPEVLVLITVVSSLGIVVLIGVSKQLFRLRDADEDYVCQA